MEPKFLILRFPFASSKYQGNSCPIQEFIRAVLVLLDTENCKGLFQLEFGLVVAVHTTGEILSIFFKGSSVFHQRASEIMDVADVQDLEVWGERYS